MADGLPKPSRSLETLLAVFGMVILTGFVFYMLVRNVMPGTAAVAVEGAGLAKLSDLVFYLFAGGAVVSGAGVAFSKNIIYSALALLGALLSTGALYVFLGAEYVAISQLLIYVGGVLVLILFAVMLTSRIADKGHTNPSQGVLPGLALLGGVIGIFAFVALKAPWRVVQDAPEPVQSAYTIGHVFLAEYLLPFEVSSLVLLATLIGAVVVARKELKE